MTTNTVAWPTGYTQNVRIINTGSAAVSGWKVTFGFPSHDRVTYSWNVTHSQSGQTVVAQPVSYDRTIPAGASLPFGFTASDSSTPAPPAWYALNGVRCKSGA